MGTRKSPVSASTKARASKASATAKAADAALQDGANPISSNGESGAGASGGSADEKVTTQSGGGTEGDGTTDGQGGTEGDGTTSGRGNDEESAGDQGDEDGQGDAQAALPLTATLNNHTPSRQIVRCLGVSLQPGESRAVTFGSELHKAECEQDIASLARLHRWDKNEGLHWESPA